MANEANPRIFMELGGRKRELILDFNTFALMEELTGLNMMDATAWKNLSMTKIRAMLYAMIEHENEEQSRLEWTPSVDNEGKVTGVTRNPEFITLRMVGSWLTTDVIEDIGIKFREILTVVLPKKKEGQQAGSRPTVRRGRVAART
jgi:hypothetical protein